MVWLKDCIEWINVPLHRMFKGWCFPLCQNDGSQQFDQNWPWSVPDYRKRISQLWWNNMRLACGCSVQTHSTNIPTTKSNTHDQHLQFSSMFLHMCSFIRCNMHPLNTCAWFFKISQLLTQPGPRKNSSDSTKQILSFILSPFQNSSPKKFTKKDAPCAQFQKGIADCCFTTRTLHYKIALVV